MSGITIIYDGDCPFCSNYVRVVRLREAVGSVEFIDARSDHPEAARLTAEGFDFDEGMALVEGGRVHFGAEAIHRIAMLSTSSGFFNRLNAWIFRRPRAAALLYPLLRRGRNLTFWLMGRRRIAA